MMSLNGSYSVSDIQDYIDYIKKNDENYLLILLFILIYINRINNELVFKVKDGYTIYIAQTSI